MIDHSYWESGMTGTYQVPALRLAVDLLDADDDRTWGHGREIDGERLAAVCESSDVYDEPVVTVYRVLGFDVGDGSPGSHDALHGERVLSYPASVLRTLAAAAEEGAQAGDFVRSAPRL